MNEIRETNDKEKRTENREEKERKIKEFLVHSKQCINQEHKFGDLK